MSKNAACTSLYQLVFRLFTFRFNTVLINSARNGVYKFSDHFCFIFFQSLIISHKLFRLVGLFFTFSYFKFPNNARWNLHQEIDKENP